MAEDLAPGVRRYTCLTPIVLVDRAGGTHEWRHIHLLPVTRRIEREWDDGLIQGPYGALEALIDRLTYEPYYVIEEMQHPDVEHFNRLFLTHIPARMGERIASGEFPSPAAPDPEYDEPSGAAPPPSGPQAGPGQAPPPSTPPRPTQPGMPPYVGPETPTGALDGLNFELARLGPDESLGSPEQQERAQAAFTAKRQGGPEVGADMQALTDEAAPGAPASPLAQAVRRSQAAPSAQQAWQPSPRDPFDPSPAPERQSRNRPPTGLPPRQGAAPPPVSSAEQSEMDDILGVRPAPVAPPPGRAAPPAGGVDPSTGREPIYDPGPSYVPDMGAVGYEEPKGNGFGIGDLR